MEEETIELGQFYAKIHRVSGLVKSLNVMRWGEACEINRSQKKQSSQSRRRNLTDVFSLDRNPPHHAAFTGVKISAGVHATPIVPHHQIADLPDMFVGEFWLFTVLKQLLQGLVALLLRQSVDDVRHQAVDVERLASRFRMRPGHRVIILWRVGIDVVAALQRIAGIVVNVSGFQTIEFFPQAGR